MPRTPSEKVKQAEQLFNDGMTMVEIAKKLGVSDGTVRSWKNRYGWGTSSKKNKCNVAKKDDKKNATLQKKKRGGQPGNKNSKGVSKGKGNPHPHPPPDRTTHGGYVPVFMDALDEDEQILIEMISRDTEIQLMEQIQLFSIRERRILKAINKCREQKGEAISSISRLEQELSTIQSKKTKAIEALYRYRMEKAKMESESAGNDAVDDWIAAVLGEEVSDDE